MVLKVATVVGARPQFIKALPVSKELRKSFQEVLIHTGQHYDQEMSAIFFEELGIPEPDYNLGVGSASQGRQVGEMLMRVEEVLLKEKPHIVLVYGDTNSTLAGALSAAKLHIPVAHIEAGLRSFDKSMPEEINRVLTDHVSDFLFCPTQTAVENLRREGIIEGVFPVGDVMLDAALYFREIAERKSRVLESHSLMSKSYLLATIHRADNTEVQQNLASIVDVFIGCDEKIVFPVHPRTRKYLKGFDLLSRLEKAPNVLIMDAVGYLDSLKLEMNARKILTDSGGMQKEAYFFQIPCITLREKTEWVETVENRWNILTGTHKDRILEAIKNFDPTHKLPQVFGDGHAASHIKERLEMLT